MADAVGGSLRYARYVDRDAAKLRERRALRWIISQQILCPQFVADFVKRLVEISRRGSVVKLATRVVRELDQGMLSAGFTSGAALDGDDDDRVDNRLRFFRRAYRLFVIDLADRVAAVGDQDD